MKYGARNQIKSKVKGVKNGDFGMSLEIWTDPNFSYLLKILPFLDGHQLKK